MDYKNLAEKLVNKCLDKGADSAEVYIESGRNQSIQIRNGEIETVEEASSHGVGFRVFVEGRMAFSNCNDFSDNSLDNAIKSAVKYAQNTTPDENNVLWQKKLKNWQWKTAGSLKVRDPDLGTLKERCLLLIQMVY